MLHQAIQVSQFAKSAQPLHYIDWLHSVWPYSIFNHKKQTSPAFALLFKHPSALNVLKLACAGKQAHIRLVHISPQTQLPTKSNHRHWERFHTTLDILRHGQTQAQPQSQHTHTHCTVNQLRTHTHKRRWEDNLYSPVLSKNTLDGNLCKGLSKRCLFYKLLWPVPFTFCQFIACFSKCLTRSVTS